jgi:protein-S-isoprenylcysteine O-methyltransferase Ste14
MRERLARLRDCLADRLRRRLRRVSPKRFAKAEALARRRVPLGFVCGGLVLWLARPTRATLIAGFAIASLGEAIRFWAAGHLHKAREVTSSGPYRWFAHPLYLGSSVMGVGLAVACRSATVAVLIALYLGATLVAASRREEAFLKHSFGDRYNRYRRPGAGSPQNAGAGRGFSLAQAIANREHRAAVGLLLVLLLLLWKTTYN